MSALSFNSSNWFEPQDVFIMATDDDIILESPYGAIVSVLSASDRPSYSNNNTITLIIDDSDTGKSTETSYDVIVELIVDSWAQGMFGYHIYVLSRVIRQ
jgi:hypothetical protein